MIAGIRLLGNLALSLAIVFIVPFLYSSRIKMHSLQARVKADSQCGQTGLLIDHGG
jgi:hypothetical protein